jgi:biopolymer transport protein ExbD
MTTQARSFPAPELMAEINITPFTDVLLVLLVIFMILVAITTPPGFQKQVPYPHEPPHGPAVIAHHPILVEVTAGDRIRLDGAAITFTHLYQMMVATIALHEQRGESCHIELVADADTSYNAIIKILDAARQAGDEDVGFVIE